MKAVNNCAEQAKASGAEGLIAIGGGSVIDTAKAANILISEGGDLVEDHSGAQTLTKPAGSSGGDTHHRRYRQRGNHGSGYL